jgi:hypothetical protein
MVLSPSSYPDPDPDPDAKPQQRTRAGFMLMFHRFDSTSPAKQGLLGSLLQPPRKP